MNAKKMSIWLLWLFTAVMQSFPQVAHAEDPPAGRLGSVRIPMRVMADGKPLAPGTYQVRLTDERAKPAAGQLEELERWVEFVQNGEVKGRELATLVPAEEIKGIAESTPPAQGGVSVHLLKSADYLRIWIHRGDHHYLVHLPPG